jgi:uncharacterized Zn ribbon protein
MEGWLDVVSDVTGFFTDPVPGETSGEVVGSAGEAEKVDGDLSAVEQALMVEGTAAMLAEGAAVKNSDLASSLYKAYREYEIAGKTDKAAEAAASIEDLLIDDPEEDS